MNPTRRPTVRARAVLPAVLLLACGGEEARDAGVQGAGTVVFKHFKVPGGGEPLERLLRRFEAENPGVRVVNETLPASSDRQHQFYVTNLEAGSSDFDVFALDVIWVPEFRRAGWLAEVGDLLSEADWDDVLPGPRAAVTWQARRYAIPWYVDGGVLYWREDLLRKHGLAPPRTLEELARTTRTVLDREGDPGLAGFVWQGRQYEGLVCVALEFITARGGAILEGNRAALARPEAVAALAFLRRLVDEGLSPPMVTSADEEATRNLFAAGRAVFLRNWPYAWNTFQREGSPVRGKVGVSAIPPFAGGRSASTLGGWQIGVNRASRRLEPARRLARFFGRPDVQKTLALEAGFKPARRSVYRDPELAREQPFVVRLEALLEGAVPRPVTPFYPMISQTLQAAFSAIVAGLQEPEAALRSAAIQIDHVLELEEG